MTIAEDEAVAFAMHFVNAQFARADVSETAAMTESLSQIVREVSTILQPEFSLDAMSVARFVTHLRHLDARIASDSQFEDDPPALLTAMHEAYPEVVGLAQKVRVLIEAQRGELSDAEVPHLEIHRVVPEMPGRAPAAELRLGSASQV